MGCVRRYADSGAGVGRITDQFLLHAFHEVDILEPLALHSPAAAMPPQAELQANAPEGLDGGDSRGGKYDSTEHMWQTELAEVDGTGQNLWYKKGVEYWAGVPATVDGVVRTHRPPRAPHQPSQRREA
jgi:hypothetical protein